jgi:hypothetical protein
MKVIKLNNGMILKERYRAVDRVDNDMMIILTSDIMYGESYDRPQVDLIKDIQLTISQSTSPAIWKDLKDASRDETMELLALYIRNANDKIAEYNKLREDTQDAIDKATARNNKIRDDYDARCAAIAKKAEDDPTYVYTDEEREAVKWKDEFVDVPDKIIDLDDSDIIINDSVAGSVIIPLFDRDNEIDGVNYFIDIDKVITVGEKEA